MLRLDLWHVLHDGDTPNTLVAIYDYGDKCIVFEVRGLSSICSRKIFLPPNILARGLVTPEEGSRLLRLAMPASSCILIFHLICLHFPSSR